MLMTSQDPVAVLARVCAGDRPLEKEAERAGRDRLGRKTPNALARFELEDRRRPSSTARTTASGSDNRHSALSGVVLQALRDQDVTRRVALGRILSARTSQHPTVSCNPVKFMIQLDGRSRASSVRFGRGRAETPASTGSSSSRARVLDGAASSLPGWTLITTRSSRTWRCASPITPTARWATTCWRSCASGARWQLRCSPDLQAQLAEESLGEHYFSLFRLSTSRRGTTAMRPSRPAATGLCAPS
jgi:hypothetical protein